MMHLLRRALPYTIRKVFPLMLIAIVSFASSIGPALATPNDGVYNIENWYKTLEKNSPVRIDPRLVYQVFNEKAFDTDHNLTNYDCRDQTAFVELTWVSKNQTNDNLQKYDIIPDTELFGFKETYPIQDGWKLKFNTPDDIDYGTIVQVPFDSQNPEYQPSYSCQHLVLATDIAPMELWSGFKSTEDTEDVGFTNNLAGIQADAIDNIVPDDKHPMNGHFAITKEFYAAVPTNDTDLNHELASIDYSVDTYSDTDYNYYPLGSVTALGGSIFPALRGGLFGEITIEPHAIRNPHWHFEYAEAGFCYQGLGQVGVIVPKNTLPVFPPVAGKPFVTDNITEEIFIKPNEIFLFPQGSQHYLRNIGNEVFKCMLFFPKGLPLNPLALLTINLNDIVNNTPLKVTGTMFNSDLAPKKSGHEQKRLKWL